MSRRKIAILSILTAAAVATLWFGVRRPSEPSLHGKTLFEWLCDGLPPPQPGMEFNPNVDQLKLLPEVVEIGTNATPTLLRWIDAKPPPFEKILTFLHGLSGDHEGEIAPSVVKQWEEISLKQAMAVRLFKEFGTNGAFGTPELIRIMDKSDHWWNRRAAMQALAGLGPSALPFLAAALTNKTSLPVHMVLTEILRMRTAQSLSPVVISALADAARSPDPNEHMKAAVILLQARAHPTNWIHVLQGTLRTPTDPNATLWFLQETRSQLRESGIVYSNMVTQLLSPADRERLREFDRRMREFDRPPPIDPVVPDQPAPSR